MKIAETIAEVIGWIKIALAPLAIGLVLGWIVYYQLQNVLGIVLGIVLAVLGLALGIYGATKAWKGKGTVYVATRHMHSPDMDQKEEEIGSEKSK